MNNTHTAHQASRFCRKLCYVTRIFTSAHSSQPSKEKKRARYKSKSICYKTPQ